MRAKLFGLPILVGLLLILTACAGGPATKNQDEPLLDRTDVFEEWYQFTYYNDLCGDPETGRLLRRLVRRKFESCPFSEAASKRFAKEMAGHDENAVVQMEKYYTTSPAQMSIKTQMCNLQVQLWTHANLLFLAKRYERGLITIDQIIPFTCDKAYQPILGDEFEEHG